MQEQTKTADWAGVPSTVAAETPTRTNDGERMVGGQVTDPSLAPSLQRRLQLVSGLAVLGYSFTTAQWLLLTPPGGWSPFEAHVCSSSFLPLALEVFALVLLTARRFGLQALRWLEVLVFGGVMLQAGWQSFAPVPPAAVTPELSVAWPVAFTITWFFIIILYGVLIPNTLRRAAIVVGLMAVIALTTLIVAWGRSPVPDGVLGRWALVSAIWLVLGCGFSVFNSARMESYRREAAVARQLGPYRLGRRLGGGGMAEVFLAEHRLLKRPCAVKLIRPDRAADDTFVKRFEREAAAAARLMHPAAVQVYDYGRADDGTFYYVMEYLPGRTLDELVRAAGPLSPSRAVNLLRQVCGALDEAHTLGLIHRDVKPGNVIVSDLHGRTDAAKLLDFGLVVATDDSDARLTRVGGLLGTPAYMSPEQARGVTDLTPACDLYSLGATAYFLLTGRPPFTSNNMLELLHAHQTEAVVPPSTHSPGIPAALETVVMRLLAKAPAERYSSVVEVEAALAAAVAD